KVDGPPAAVALVSRSISGPAAAVPKGLGVAFTAAGTYSDGSKADLTAQAQWSVADAAVAAVAGPGSFLAAGAGVTQITATVGDVSARSSFSVAPAAMVAVSVTPLAPVLSQGDSLQLAATAVLTDGSRQDVTSAAAWSSSSPAVTVSDSGRISALAAGAAVITASTSSLQGAVQVTIGDAVLRALAIAPDALALPAGLSGTLRAMGTYSDGSTRDLTASVIWSSSDPAVAPVASGTVQAMQAGSAT